MYKNIKDVEIKFSGQSLKKVAKEILINEQNEQIFLYLSFCIFINIGSLL
jgi:hypothetical protein